MRRWRVRPRRRAGQQRVRDPAADSELATVDLDQTRAGFETNVLGALRLTRLFAPALAETQGAVVMINSSVLRHSSQPYGAYKMSKAALLALAQSLATELGPQGVRVNSVAPGYIWADTLKNYFAYLADKRGVDAQVIYDETAANMDLRRLPEPDQIADAVVFMASDISAGHHRPLPRRQLRGVPPLMSTPARAGRADIGTIDDLHAAATKITGLDDFGGTEYREGLRCCFIPSHGTRS